MFGLCDGFGSWTAGRRGSRASGGHGGPRNNGERSHRGDSFEKEHGEGEVDFRVAESLQVIWKSWNRQRILLMLNRFLGGGRDKFLVGGGEGGERRHDVCWKEKRWKRPA